MAVLGAAPCQCLMPGGHQMTSPGRISSTGPPHCCVLPTPEVTTRYWPLGWVCQAERAPCSNVTYALVALMCSLASYSGSIRARPVKYACGPSTEFWVPVRVIVCAEPSCPGATGAMPNMSRDSIVLFMLFSSSKTSALCVHWTLLSGSGKGQVRRWRRPSLSAAASWINWGNSNRLMNLID